MGAGGARAAPLRARAPRGCSRTTPRRSRRTRTTSRRSTPRRRRRRATPVPDADDRVDDADGDADDGGRRRVSRPPRYADDRVQSARRRPPELRPPAPTRPGAGRRRLRRLPARFEQESGGGRRRPNVAQCVLNTGFIFTCESVHKPRTAMTVAPRPSQGPADVRCAPTEPVTRQPGAPSSWRPGAVGPSGPRRAHGARRGPSPFLGPDSGRCRADRDGLRGGRREPVGRPERTRRSGVSVLERGG